MNWEDITIGVLVIVILYLLFKNKTEKFETINIDNAKMNTKEYYQALCNKTTEIHNNAKEYLGNNCSEEKMDELRNFRGSINNRSWCRIKGEEEITSDINKDTWCVLSASDAPSTLTGYSPKSLEDLGEYVPSNISLVTGTLINDNTEITPNI